MAEMAELKRRPHDSGEDALLVPTGAPLYESLSARLIAYDRLVSTLGRGGYSGYVRVLGPGVNGGLVGKHPSLADLDAGDLKHHTDFRGVYATLLDGWLGCDSRAVLGDRFAPVALLKKA